MFERLSKLEPAWGSCEGIATDVPAYSNAKKIVWPVAASASPLQTADGLNAGIYALSNLAHLFRIVLPNKYASVLDR
jgi:hypothetical protein